MHIPFNLDYELIQLELDILLEGREKYQKERGQWAVY